jgi:hypothetical protein
MAGGYMVAETLIRTCRLNPCAPFFLSSALLLRVGRKKKENYV